MAFDASVDIRISPDKDETLYGFRGVGKIPDMPNYASWRVNIGMHIILLPTRVYKVSERDILMQKAEERRKLFEKVIREQREAESAEKELERIKAERRKAERELERLRNILEQEAKKKQQEKKQQEPKPDNQ
ncbi:MAG: DUF1682 domain-containing protein [Calditrichaeota bacterium]|nr:DUF1682 domain-containing protein [Calditrichota bacterium]